MYKIQKMFSLLFVAIFSFNSCKQDSLKPEGLQMNENYQNDRVLYRYLSQEEEQNIISEIKQDPLFFKHADTIVSVLAESGINFNDIVDSIRTNNPSMNSNNLKTIAMQVIENNPNIKEHLREFALEQHYQCLIYIEQHEVLRFVYLDQSLMVLHNALVQYIQESGV